MGIEYIILVSAIVISIIAFFIIFITFNTYYSGIGFTIMSSYLLIVIYSILEVIIYNSNNESQALNISKFSTMVLVTGLYFLHYFHDEISAAYKQRKTMTFASLVYGMNIGAIFLEDTVTIIGDPFVPVLHPYFGLLITWQATLLIHRITSHLINMGELSDYYGIEGKVNPKFRKGVQKTLYIFLAFSAISYLIIDEQPSTNLTLVIAVGGLLLATLYNRDPLSSLPIAQPIEAIALIREERVKYLEVFESSGKSIAKQDDFGILVSTLIQFFTEMMKSETRIRSISTNDVLIMFEISGFDYLILVLKNRSPLVRRILKLVSTEILDQNPQSDYEFSMIVNKYLLFRTTSSTNA
ncbi:MAG: hypothetical protein GPJ54_22505 [Candidatus Heimdallarchaeota archaeon]|nr:hypothetical protein [Candidatus Heimdallarchaeota archaeon]